MISSDKIKIFKYIIVYKTDDFDEDYTPVKMLSRDEINENNQTLHLIPRDILSLTELFYKIFHLPRCNYDLWACSDGFKGEYIDIEHDILFLPVQALKAELFDRLDLKNLLSAQLILFYDDIEKKDLEFLEDIQSQLGLVCFSDFISSTPSKWWAKLLDIYNVENVSSFYKEVYNEFLPIENIKLLPVLYLEIYLGYLPKNYHDYLDRVYQNIDISIKLDNYMWFLKTILEIKDKNLDMNDEVYQNTYRKHYGVNYKSLVITCPGISSNEKRNARASNSNLTKEENFAIQILGCHRAIKEHSLYMNLNQIKSEMFDVLFEIEDHCQGDISNKYIWKSLKKLGKLFNDGLTDFEKKEILTAESIRYFSDFPIGICILPNMTSPLSCSKPISGISLTPLIRDYQLEFGKNKTHVVSNLCKVIVIECVKPDDRIYKLSKEAWEHVCDTSKILNHLQIELEEATSVFSFKKILKKHNNADILVISAHGEYDINKNLTGFHIRDELWMANDSDYWVPPVVIFSACHVSPKGRGSINVSELLFRNGAISIIGTLIPINVISNIYLMNRFFVYINESFDNPKLNTLDKIWHHVIATHAVIEISNTTQKLKKWISTKKEDISPLEQFMLIDSVGKIRGNHAYNDTIKILTQIAKRDNLDTYLEQVIDSQGVFPESVFYTLYGHADKVIFVKT